MTSKRGVFGGNGPSSQNGVSGSGVIQSPNGCRLANAMAAA